VDLDRKDVLGSAGSIRAAKREHVTGAADFYRHYEEPQNVQLDKLLARF
jgi:hypothetical protein